MSNNRRKFIQQIGALGGVGLVSATGINEVINNQENSGSADADGTTTLTILQTTDVHCQVHPHDELFWENGKSGKTGGYAHLATFLEKEKKRNVS
jgi:sulfur-oxidizing protein SoxB